MARSPAHKFGQIIGDALESAIDPILGEFAREHGLYLDKKGRRPARKGRKVTWIDAKGNAHDLDFVLERGGTDANVGTPVAFIETAYRRYTKHSRNKVQEIQGAILPLVETHRNAAPFFGAILAGIFTESTLAQLRSLGFAVLHIPNDSIIRAFRTVGVEAEFDEHTSDAELRRKVRTWEKLAVQRHLTAARALLALHSPDINEFMALLERSVTRRITSVRIIPLHGQAFECEHVADAIAFINAYDDHGNTRMPLIKYEVQIRFTNGDRIEGTFADKAHAVHFLRISEPC